MTQHQIPFSLCIQVGSSEIPEALSGSIEVNLYDDPKDDEINDWKVQPPFLLHHKTIWEMERLAIEQARRQQAADQGEAAIAKTSEFCG